MRTSKADATRREELHLIYRMDAFVAAGLSPVSGLFTATVGPRFKESGLYATKFDSRSVLTNDIPGPSPVIEKHVEGIPLYNEILLQWNLDMQSRSLIQRSHRSRYNEPFSLAQL